MLVYRFPFFGKQVPAMVFIVVLTLTCKSEPLFATTTTFSLAPNSGVGSISPMAYGSNHLDIVGVPFRRFGGNRASAYNWENNASNAGVDYFNNNDYFLLGQVGLPQNGSQAPAAVPVRYAQLFRAAGTTTELITVQALGYVSADAAGSVTAGQVAPSSRWKQVLPTKPGAPASFVLSPDQTDAYVYMDEQVNCIVNKLGSAAAGGIRCYSIDNEPGIWSSTHPLSHPSNPTYAEIYAKASSTAKAILSVDGGAEIFAPASFGWGEFVNMQGASDSAPNNASYGWFLGYFLAQMRSASLASGKRLLHYLDLHWYPEAQGGGSRITFGSPDNISQACSIARMQAPRSLWDPSYIENSWITSNGSGPAIDLIHQVQTSIDNYYPGTKLAISEYNYGASNHISGGIAQADVLGILGKYGVAGNYWHLGGSANYIQAAYNLYLNYNGSGSTFADLSFAATSSDSINTSIYAAKRSIDNTTLTLVVLNKDWSAATSGNFNFSLNPGESISSIATWRFNSSAATLASVPAPSFSANSFSDNLPALSATLYEVHVFLGTPTPTFTVSETFSPSPTFSVSPTLTVSPTISPTSSVTATPSLTALWPFQGVNKILQALPFPNPGARSLAIHLDGPADKVHLRIYSAGYKLVSEISAGPLLGGWNQIAFSASGLPKDANGLYYFRVLARRQGSPDSSLMGRIYLLR